MGGCRHGETCRGLKGLLRALFICSFALAMGAISPALAQDPLPACSPAVARLVSLQGTVEIQRPGAAWLPVRRLDTVMCAGDKLRAGDLSRALLFLQPETFVRVDQNTSISLSVAGEEIEVEFFAAELAAELRSSESRGAGYFITRFPKKFKVKTPHMNAAVEGTEFMVQLSDDATKLTVLEGQVSLGSAATSDRQLVAAGQSLQSGRAGVGTITTVIKPEDAVQWVLRYPPLADAGTAVSPESCSTLPEESRVGCFTQRADSLLRLGHPDDALRDIVAALALEPNNGDVNALRAIVQIAKNDKAGAMESSRRAVNAEAGNFRAWLALSYAQQASFALEGALDSARKAQALSPDSSLVQARAAELLLSLGHARESELAARAAIADNPSESHAHSVLGFVQLAQVRIPEALAAFEAAIEHDSFASLPRLGKGLALIRDGQLVTGREQLEIAVALDPGDSLLRSYVGKAYYEENTGPRDELAGTQFGIASGLDPRDPTPHLYEAIRLQTANRPVEALREIRQSVALNDNRAVYRSEFKLDEDLAVRGASQGRIYSDLGFEELALLDGWSSVMEDPGDFSGHRLLADTYSSQPRHEVARVNELFISQLLQPQNLTPVPPQLGEANLFILDSAGPSEISFNEFGPLFNGDGQALHASAVAGSNETWGDDVAFAAVQGRWSMNLGQYHFETEGFRANNDLEQDIYSAFVQYRQSERTGLLTEVRASRREQGDLRLLFDPENFDPSARSTEDAWSARFGLHHQFSPRSELMAVATYQSADLESGQEIASIPAAIEIKLDVETIAGEIQHVLNSDRWRLVSGLRQSLREETEFQILTIPVPFPPFEIVDVTPGDFSYDNTSAYAYGYFDLSDSVNLIIGASGDWWEGRDIEIDQVNPKFGLTWQSNGGTTLRLAAIRALQPLFYSRQDIPPRLEPTQVSGFNQQFSGPEGESFWRYGLGLDHQFAGGFFAGAEVSARDVEFPVIFVGPPDLTYMLKVEEQAARAYAFWTPTNSVALGATYQYDRKSNDLFAASEDGLNSLRTNRVPLTAAYFHPAGFAANMTVTYVDQEANFQVILPGPVVESVERGERFWVLDAGVRYRLPRRKGIIALEGDNLLDEEFNFQDVDPENPEIVPDRFYALKFTIAF
jgi:tetratricopeptide (TPR) repeat protein